MDHLQVLELVRVCLACDQDRLVIVFPQMFSESNGITLKPAEVKIFSEQNADPHDLVKVFMPIDNVLPKVDGSKKIPLIKQ